MSVRIKVDRQGRVVIPLSERDRLGITEGGTLELIGTPEGLLLERRSPAHVVTAADGFPLILREDARMVSNQESLDALARARERA